MIACLDAVAVAHNAFRRDISEIDQAVHETARQGGDLSSVIDRLQYFGGIIDRHEKAEEQAVFPDVDKVLSPLLAPMFADDHREISEAVGEVVSAQDELAAARASAALHSQVRIQLAKKDIHLYAVLRDRIDLDEEAEIVGQLWGRVFPPDEVLPQYMNWLYRHVNQDDQATITNVWKYLMSEKDFTKCIPLIREAVTNEDWSALTKRVPSMA